MTRRHHQPGVRTGWRLAIAIAALGAVFTVAEVRPRGEQYPNPAAMASALKAAGQSTDQIAAQVVQVFKLTATQLAATLKGIGSATGQVVKALSTVMKANINVITAAMKGAGYTVNQVADGLFANNFAHRAIGMALKAMTSEAKTIALILKSKNAVFEDVLAVMLQGYQLHCAVGSASTVNCPAASVMRQAGYTAPQVGRALRLELNMTASDVAKVLTSVFSLQGDALRSALQGCGFTQAQINEALNAAVTAVVAAGNATINAATTAGASAVDLDGIVHTTHRTCYYPAGQLVYGTPGMPLPLPAGSRTITLYGHGLALVTNIVDLPAGTRATIRERNDCYLVVDVSVPGSAPAGSRGEGTLRVGTSQGPRFAWTVGPIPATPTGRYSGPAAGSGGRATPVTNPGGGGGTVDLVTDFSGVLLRFAQANSRRISDQFCSSVAPSTIAEITVPDLTWGVINSSNFAVTSTFRIELANNTTNQVLATVDVPQGRLVPGTPRYTQTYRRPQSRTRVIRITPASPQALRTQYGGQGCFQAVMTPGDPLNWQDPPFRVRVDVTNRVGEGAGGEINNSNVY